MQWPPLLLSCLVVVATSMVEAYSLQRKNVWSPNRAAAVWLSPYLQPDSEPDPGSEPDSEPDLATQLNNNDIETDSEFLERIGKRGFTTISRWRPSRKEEERLRTRPLLSSIPGLNFIESIRRKTRQGIQEKYRRPIGLPLRWG